MGRQAAPRWYESRKGWYVEIAGKQVMLAKGKAGKAEAFEAFHRMMAEGVCPARRVELSVEILLDLFIEGIRGKVEPVTLEGYQRRLQTFVDLYGGSKAKDLRPFHVSRWLDLHPSWSDSTRFGCVTALKRAYNWARKQGHLEANPIADAERPPMGRRTAVLSESQYRATLELVDVPRLRRFRDLLVALWETGCRPAEVVTMTAGRFDPEAKTWRVHNKTRRKTGEPFRTIHLSDTALELSRRLVADHPEGPLFRNHRGRPWTRHAMACNFARVRLDLGYGAEVTAYSFRHRWATDGLLAGVPIATMAAMMGHTSTTMISRHYGHLSDHPDHLKEALGQIRPDATGGGNSSASDTT